jgi:hypothetical protein
MTTIIEKLRNSIEDNLITTGRDSYTYESITSSKIFTLTEANISAATIVVLKNGVVWAGTNYSYFTTTGKITVTGTLVAGDSLEVNYSYYAKYSDTELQGRIKSAITYLSVEKYGTFAIKSDNVIFPTPNEGEENLIALIASILIKGDITSYRTPELSITFARGETIENKIKKFIRQCKKSYGYLTFIDLGAKIVYDGDEDNL